MIGNSENRISYNGNGIATEFAYTFKILEKTDIKVLHVAADGTETLLAKDYYVDMEKCVVLYPGYAPGAEPPEANRPPVLPLGERLVLYREVPITQDSVLDKHWPFNVIEAGLDKLTIICQQIWDRANRSFYVSPATNKDFNSEVPIAPGKTFRVNDDGTGFEVTEDPGKVIDGATALLEQTTEQANIAVASSTNAQNAAQKAYDDGKALIEQDVADAQNAANTSKSWQELSKAWAEEMPGDETKLLPTGHNSSKFWAKALKEKYEGEFPYVTPQMFGAVGDGVTDDSIFVQQAIDCAITNKIVLLLTSMYNIGDTTLSVSDAINIIASGNSDVTKQIGCGFKHNSVALALSSARNVTLKNIAFKQTSTTQNINAITINGNCSCLTVDCLDFYDVTGYCIKFISPTYSQMLSMHNLSAWSCGGVIGGDGVGNDDNKKGLVCTCADINNISLDDGINQISPQNPILDLIAFREYTASNIVIEGLNGNGATCLRVGNSRWNIVNGCHMEFSGSNKPILGTEVAQNVYQTSNSSNVHLTSVPLPIKVSANYCNVFLDGNYLYTSDKFYSVTGIASRIILNNNITKAPNYNIFNFDDFGKVEHSNVCIAEISNSIPMTLQPYITLFDWDASKGDITTFSNPYFYAQTIGVTEKGIVTTEDIGTVYQMKNPTNDLPTIAFRFKNLNPFIGKTITISMTYRVLTSATQGLEKFNVINYMSNAANIGLINSRVPNEIAIAGCSIIPNAGSNGFISNNGSGYLNAPATFQIIGVKIVLGNTVIGTPLQL